MAPFISGRGLSLPKLWSSLPCRIATHHITCGCFPPRAGGNARLGEVKLDAALFLSTYPRGQCQQLARGDMSRGRVVATVGSHASHRLPRQSNCRTGEGRSRILSSFPLAIAWDIPNRDMSRCPSPGQLPPSLQRQGAMVLPVLDDRNHVDRVTRAVATYLTELTDLLDKASSGGDAGLHHQLALALQAGRLLPPLRYGLVIGRVRAVPSGLVAAHATGFGIDHDVVDSVLRVQCNCLLRCVNQLLVKTERIPRRTTMQISRGFSRKSLR